MLSVSEPTSRFLQRRISPDLFVMPTGSVPRQADSIPLPAPSRRSESRSTTNSEPLMDCFGRSWRPRRRLEPIDRPGSQMVRGWPFSPSTALRIDESSERSSNSIDAVSDRSRQGCRFCLPKPRSRPTPGRDQRSFGSPRWAADPVGSEGGKPAVPGRSRYVTTVARQRPPRQQGR